MKQLCLPFRCGDKKEYIIEGPDYHYLTHVLRLQIDETFFGIDTAGKKFLFSIKSFKTDSILLYKLDEEPAVFDLPAIILYQALPKGKAMDRIIRHATEIGVTGIVPVISRYTVVELKEQDRKANKVARWMTIVKEAVQQSGSAVLPFISEPIKLPDAVKQARGVKLFFHQEKLADTGLHRSLASHMNDNNVTISVFTGCEGGFSTEEVGMMKSAGCIPVYAGVNVLRADTAALFALAAIKVLLLEKEQWRIV